MRPRLDLDHWLFLGVSLLLLLMGLLVEPQAALADAASPTVLGFLAGGLGVVRLVYRLCIPSSSWSTKAMWTEHLSWWVWASLALLGASVLIWNPEARSGVHLYGLAIDAELRGRLGAQWLKDLSLPMLALLGFFWYLLQALVGLLSVLPFTRRMAWRLSLVTLGLAWYFGGLRWDLVAFVFLWWTLVDQRWWPAREPGTVTVVFDGMCNLCNRSISALIWIDRASTLCFAPLQGKWAQTEIATLARESGQSVDLLDGTTVLTVSTSRPNESLDLDPSSAAQARVWLRSEAVLQAVISLGGLKASAAALLRWTPVGLRDWIYVMIARNRVQWFGQSATCRIPSAEEKSRFRD